VMMLDCRQLGDFGRRLHQARARLVLEITGTSTLPDVRYQVSALEAYDPARPPAAGEPTLLCANTTTLVDVVLNRRQTDKLLQVKDSELRPLRAPAAAAPPARRTGRAALLSPDTVK